MNSVHKKHTDNLRDIAELAHCRIVLSHPSHPGNIGSVARAMKTMGLSRLYLVNPTRYPSAEADALASGATDVLQNATVVASLDAALMGCTQVVGLSARRRELTVPVETPRALVPSLLAHCAMEETVALVFGTEMSGLSNDEARRCNYLMSIPANPDYSSLNLAQAVQIIAYELRLGLEGAGVPVTNLDHLNEFHPKATYQEVAHLYEDIENTLIAVNFLNPQQPKRLMPRLRRLLGRTQLEKVEVDILRGLLRAVREKIIKEVKR